MHPSPERYTKEGTANACVHDRVSKYVKGHLYVLRVCFKILCPFAIIYDIPHTHSLILYFSDLPMHLTFADKAQ